MQKKRKRAAARIGLPPGTLCGGDDRSAQPRLWVTAYDEAGVNEQEIGAVGDVFPLRPAPAVTWLDVRGASAAVVEEIGRRFAIHPLVLEDILNIDHRPKLEDYDHYLFIVLKALALDGASATAGGAFGVEQISVILGKNYVITFQESDNDIFRPVRERIKSGKGRIRKVGADYLAYALIDTVVDHYFVLLEELDERIEALEDALAHDPGPKVLDEIHKLKNRLLHLRRSLWPLREVIGAIDRGDSALFQDSTLVYMRDVYDHTVQVLETIETYRDILSGMLDIYLSSINNRLSEIMKFLTLISTVFIPLTFIAGVYGMNFEYMPELKWRWGYPAVLGLMALVGGWLVVYFRRKKWL
ncbi:magnesium and cobalt transport protein CorA [Thermosinus carboxydivorans Nor1]|uniref:Magnesium transport protein CorA n=1 Tax=Thermosinus carboxydivorans Nor1 TaxID=401526 RepID=A1HPQ9_9FIRM|nr:magnesium/cobalt transporter CorA [Thermosinus carboxydivorans]EAX48029.1 magnesium and cobalt transport protein CorA [Thermosinus carboxydivorans Nor1]